MNVNTQPKHGKIRISEGYGGKNQYKVRPLTVEALRRGIVQWTDDKRVSLKFSQSGWLVRTDFPTIADRAEKTFQDIEEARVYFRAEAKRVKDRGHSSRP